MAMDCGAGGYNNDDNNNARISITPGTPPGEIRLNAISPTKLNF